MKEALTRLRAPATPGIAVARRPPSKPMSTISIRRSSASARPAAARAIARRASSRGARRSSSSSRSAEPGGSPAVATGASRTSPWRSPSGRLEAAELLRHRSGEDDGQLRAAGGDGGDKARDVVDRSPLVRAGRLARAEEHGVDRGVEEHRRHRQWVRRLGRCRRGLPAAPPGGLGERRRPPARTPRSRRVAAAARSGRPGAAGSLTASARPIPERAGKLRVGRRRPLEQETNDGVDIDRRQASPARRSGAIGGVPGRRAQPTRWRRQGRGRGRLSGRSSRRHATLARAPTGVRALRRLLVRRPDHDGRGCRFGPERGSSAASWSASRTMRRASGRCGPERALDRPLVRQPDHATDERRDSAPNWALRRRLVRQPDHATDERRDSAPNGALNRPLVREPDHATNEAGDSAAIRPRTGLSTARWSASRTRAAQREPPPAWAVVVATAKRPR